ncbi:30S ribosomal protein S14 [Candidatus Vidania fulgoroideorum]
MSKKSLIEREKKRNNLYKKNKKIKINVKKTTSKNSLKIIWQFFPRNSMKIRKRKRCFFTGRPRGVFGKFGISRIILRENIINGEIAGFTRSSW